MLSNKTQNKIIIYEIIIFIIFIYVSTWFIHNIVDRGSGGNSGNIGTNINDENGNNEGNNNGNGNSNGNNGTHNNGTNGNGIDNNNGQIGNNNGSGNINQIENNNGIGSNGQTGNNGNGNNGSGGILDPGIIIIPDNPPLNEGNEEEDIIIDSKNRIIVKEDGITDWNKLNVLSFFENNYYLNKLIAPGVKGSYLFTVENMLNTECVYDIKYMEENPYNINLQYRLMLNGEYIVGGPTSWVRCTDLSTVGTHLNANSVNIYKVDWKWEDADNDTSIGRNPNSYYRMKIKVDAIEIVP